MQSLRNKQKMYQSLPDEKWILESQSRMSTGFGGAPGFLSISNKRIIFEPAKTSITRAMAEIKIENILRAKKTRNLLIIPNSIKFFTKDGRSYKFTITAWKRDKIIELLKKYFKK